MANRLATESSPYLLQHKDNPVDWFPWGDEALAKARAEDKPLLVSIGYSACHWCHVMAHESFEDPATAALMNERFVNVKVDREERPDLDSIYMTAVHAMTGQGGWPLNFFATADGSPVYGGTYWPPQDRQGMPAFQKVLLAVSDAYRDQREDLLQNADQIRSLVRQSMVANRNTGTLQTDILETAATGLGRLFDGGNGGFGSAPKFPQPSVLEFLLRRHRSAGDERAAKMVRLTLDKMAAGGVYDQVGGGFHRYAVDAVWLVPHFEKMLYDNAQLARLYTDAHRSFGDEAYRRIATETLDYVLREMTDPDGGFYSTQDADSEGEEGTFYVWTPAEIDEIAGPEDGPIVRLHWAVSTGGNFEGRNILSVPRTAETIAGEAGVSVEELRAAVARAKAKLYAARETRVHPGRDEKVLSGWNGMMMRAFAEASRAFDRADYRDAAVANARLVKDRMRSGGKLLHSFKDGEARIGGFLEDYANVIDGLIAVYEATFDRRWFNDAVALAWTMVVEFADRDGAAFYDTAESAEQLISRPRDLHDGATPAGNSVAASVLLRLGRFTGNGEFERLALETLQMMARPMAEQPIGFGRFLSGVEAHLATPREVAVAGRRGDAQVDSLAGAVYARFEPNTILGLADPDDEDAASAMPFLAQRPMQGGSATAYLCERNTCLPPVHEPVELLIQLEQGTGIEWQEF
ncbi:MAG: thioredoxin domain-containing protein [Thermomicrobiales bacterium]